MSRVSSSLRDSLFGLIRREAVHAPPLLLVKIRSTMLLALADASTDQQLKLERVILFAKEIDALWYVRPELMSAVASHLGEANASRRMAEITQLFEGYVPGSTRRT